MTASTIDDRGKHRVAYELMTTIANSERVQKDREYYLRLYRQCIESVNTQRPINDVVTGGTTPRAMTAMRM